MTHTRDARRLLGQLLPPDAPTLCGAPGGPHDVTRAEAERFHARHELGLHVECLPCCRLVRLGRIAEPAALGCAVEEGAPS